MSQVETWSLGDARRPAGWLGGRSNWTHLQSLVTEHSSACTLAASSLVENAVGSFFDIWLWSRADAFWILFGQCWKWSRFEDSIESMHMSTKWHLDISWHILTHGQDTSGRCSASEFWSEGRSGAGLDLPCIHCACKDWTPELQFDFSRWCAEFDAEKVEFLVFCDLLCLILCVAARFRLHRMDLSHSQRLQLLWNGDTKSLSHTSQYECTLGCLASATSLLCVCHAWPDAFIPTTYWFVVWPVFRRSQSHGIWVGGIMAQCSPTSPTSYTSQMSHMYQNVTAEKGDKSQPKHYAKG